MLPPNDGSQHCVDGSWTPTVLQEFTSTYAVVALDPVASVRFLDAEAAVAAKELKTEKYIALVLPKFGWYDASHTPHYELDLWFVGRGLPNNPELHMDESMSVPIYPAKDHPESRPPLHPSRPLPWAECYHHTLIRRSQGDAGRIYTSNDSPLTVSQLDWDKLRVISTRDSSRAAAISRANGYDSTSESEYSDDDMSSMDDGGSVVSPPHSGDVIEDMLMNHRGICPTFDIWLDLGVLENVPDPVNFRKELNRLEELENECENRQKAKYKEMKAQRKEMQARTEAWAGQLDAEETNIENSKREPLEQPQSSVQPSPSSREDSARIDPKFTKARKSDSFSVPISCSGRVISSWTNKLRMVYIRSRSQVIRMVNSSRKGIFRPKQRTLA